MNDGEGKSQSECCIAGTAKNQDTLGWNICDQGKGTHVWLQSLPDWKKKKVNVDGTMTTT